MMLALQAHEFIPIAVERTLDSLIGGLVLSGVAWTWLRVARRQNSASRFIILFILLIGIAVLPIAGLSTISGWMSDASATGNSAHSLLTLPQNAAEYIFLVWAAIAFAGLARIAVGFRQLRKLQRSCVAIDASRLDERISASLLASSRPAMLCTSDRVNVPTALGFARPARIVIPSWLLDQLSADELHHLVLHELAHLRRWDDWSNLAQKILGALLFFHPAVWWLQNRLSLEREMACDECVLAQTGNARAYAKSLATIAERSFVRRTVALAQAAVSRLHDTTLRVSKILTPATARRSTSAVPLLASVAALSGLTLAVALFSPDLVSFAEPAAPATLAAAHPVAVKAREVQPKAILASMLIAHPLRNKNMTSTNSASASASFTQRPVTGPTTQAVTVIPAKVTLHRNAKIAHPAVLIFWQETYDNGSGLIIQRSFWRVVVLQNTPKEQPKAI